MKDLTLKRLVILLSIAGGGGIIGILAGAAGAGMRLGTVETKLIQNDREHESMSRLPERLARIEQDVAWIRAELEKKKDKGQP